MQPVVDPIQQSKQLGELRDAGVLSDEEFAAKKADILSRPVGEQRPVPSSSTHNTGPRQLTLPGSVLWLVSRAEPTSAALSKYPAYRRDS